jgi:hypothetical protein
MCRAAVTAGARADFQSARRRHLAASVRRKLAARRHGPSLPRDLGDVRGLFWRPARLRSIPLDAVVGTVDATADFDADFRPTTRHLSSRWQSVARAHRAGRSLPPIAVIERPDGYYVLDGRHRVSVARALGQHYIDAWASPAPGPRPAQLPAAQEKAMTSLTHRLVQAVTHALHADGERVHFHAGDHGRPYVCEDRRCASPSLHVTSS